MDAGHDPDDVLGLGGGKPGGWRPRLPGGWRPSRGTGILAAAALAVGLAAGYAAGDRHALAGSPRTIPTAASTVTAVAPSATASPDLAAPATAFSFADSPALTQDTGSCSTQTGHQLQLGVQVSNQSADAVTLRTARAVLPLGGLRQLAEVWGPCGSLQAGTFGAGADVLLLPGAATWLTITFRVQIPCPVPLPVRFAVRYLAKGHSVTASLPGFPDLGGVPYSGCRNGAQIAFNQTVTP